ncbi:hypothetical protein C1Y63_01255 [Corynebacterium sp. 13CS0277]|uniref:hypothetical protein n=1 Tax=Corynebacterium sp. 13CS0277 TaxID=2071994 RepID=UPI000D035FD3|nr:hypothetical protein [Corynebacterium sp. 13CS0277]PRQ12448.1 hypothetical protein C1Y63_01255 [Corynebacterium sp. 13CS0277]
MPALGPALSKLLLGIAVVVAVLWGGLALLASGKQAPQDPPAPRCLVEPAATAPAASLPADPLFLYGLVATNLPAQVPGLKPEGPVRPHLAQRCSCARGGENRTASHSYVIDPAAGSDAAPGQWVAWLDEAMALESGWELLPGSAAGVREYARPATGGSLRVEVTPTSARVEGVSGCVLR